MCGILGIFPYTDKPDPSLLNPLRHRGPDDSGLMTVGNGILGHTRLSIIDPTSVGRQPMEDSTGRWVIVFNGEIYNYRELRQDLKRKGVLFQSRSDTEVILNGYREWGLQLFPKLRGMFALAIYDRETQDLLLARDRLGIKPLLYSTIRRRIIFSSELKGLIQQSLVPTTIDSVAVTQLLHYGAIQQPRSIFKHIHFLPSGHVLIQRESGELKIEPFCHAVTGSSTSQPLNYDEAVSKLRALLNQATQYHLVSDVEVGCFLSGGIDSTAVLALMQQQVNHPIQTFTLGFTDDQEDLDESANAERSAHQIGARFNRIVFTEKDIASCFQDFLSAVDQPSMDGFNTYLVSRGAHTKLKVVLSGLGGDELFAGYPSMARILNYSHQLSRPWDPIFRKIHSFRPNRYTQKSMFRARNMAYAWQGYRTVFSNWECNRILSESQVIQPPFPVTSRSVLQNISLLELRHYLQNTLLRDSDAVSMWHGLELRPVLLDQDVVEFAFQLPDEYKIRDGRLKAVFIDAVKDVLPEDILARPKKGFELPFSHWMNGVLNSQLIELWHTSGAQHLFQPPALKKLIQRTKDKRLSRRDWVLAVLAGWHNQLVID